MTLTQQIQYSKLFTVPFRLLYIFMSNYYAPDRRKGGNKRCFCPSVHPSRTWRIIREPKGLSCPNLEGRLPTLDATRTPASRSNGHRSGLEAGGGVPCRLTSAATLLVLTVPVCTITTTKLYDRFSDSMQIVYMNCYYSAKAGSCDRCCLSVRSFVRSVCEQDKSQTRLRMVGMGKG